MLFFGIFDRHKFFHHFLPFQKLIWTIIFSIDFEIRSISEKEKDSFEWMPGAKLLKNLIFEPPKPQKTKIYLFALKPLKLPEGPLWASSSSWNPFHVQSVPRTLFWDEKMFKKFMFSENAMK